MSSCEQHNFIESFVATYISQKIKPTPPTCSILCDCLCVKSCCGGKTFPLNSPVQMMKVFAATMKVFDVSYRLTVRIIKRSVAGTDCSYLSPLAFRLKFCFLKFFSLVSCRKRQGETKTTQSKSRTETTGTAITKKSQ